MNTDTEGHGLGRVVSPPDPRDGEYPARALMRSTQPQKMYRAWYSDVIHIDQGPIGQCTTASLAHILHDGPDTHRPYWSDRPMYATVERYCRAQQLDGLTATYCTHRNDTGATMRAAAKAVQELGLVANYWWFSGIDEALAYLANQGPLWVGTWWTAGMERIDERGHIHYTGSRMGGHAYKVDQVSFRGEWVGIKNTWGRSWGKNGRARLSFDDFARLLSDQGEALAITEQRVT